MVRDLVLDAQAAEPAIGQVYLHFTAQRPLGADREHVADDQHPDHEHRIDRRTADRRIVRGQFRVDPGKVQNRGYLTDMVIAGNGVIETE